MGARVLQMPLDDVEQVGLEASKRWSAVTTRLLARGSTYAAAYVVLTLIAGAFGLASGQVQFRIPKPCCRSPASIPRRWSG